MPSDAKYTTLLAFPGFCAGVCAEPEPARNPNVATSATVLIAKIALVRLAFHMLVSPPDGSTTGPFS